MSTSNTRTNSPLVGADEEKKLKEKLTKESETKSISIFGKSKKTVKLEKIKKKVCQNFHTNFHHYIFYCLCYFGDN
jgi:hypothetical protein